jgi:hypothetical protein
MILMQCSGVNSENSSTVNFDSMCVLSSVFPRALSSDRIRPIMYPSVFLTFSLQVLGNYCFVSDCDNFQLGYADVVLIFLLAACCSVAIGCFFMY